MMFLCASADKERETDTVERPSTDSMLCCLPDEFERCSEAFAGTVAPFVELLQTLAPNDVDDASPSRVVFEIIFARPCFFSQQTPPGQYGEKVRSGGGFARARACLSHDVGSAAYPGSAEVRAGYVRQIEMG